MTTARRLEIENASQAIDPLERRLTAALEAAPAITIPDDFAARVMSRLPTPIATPYGVAARTSIGRRVSMVAAAALFIAMFVFAIQRGGANESMRLQVEAIIAAEFIILTVWLSLRPGDLR